MNMEIKDATQLLQEFSCHIEQAKSSKSNFNELINSIQQLSQQIPNHSTDSANPNSVLQNCCRSITKIQFLSKIKIKTLEEYFKSTSEGRFYQFQISILDAEIEKNKSKLKTNLEVIENLNNAQGPSLEAIFTKTEKEINSLKEPEQAIQNYAEYIKSQSINGLLSQKTTSLFAKVTQKIGVDTNFILTTPNWSMPNSLSYLSEKILSWASYSLCSNISNPDNKFVSCHFSALSTGKKAAFFIPSLTKGLIKIRFPNDEEFWLNFNLNENPIIDAEYIDYLQEMVLELFTHQEITVEEITEMHEELNALIIPGRKETVKGSDIFNNLKLDITTL